MGQIENDNYPTPQPLADKLIQEQVDNGVVPAVVIEPSCGAGAFIKAARKAWPNARIIGIDIVDYRRQAIANGADEFVCAPMERVIADILEAEQELGRVLVIGNPPFSLAEEHITLIMRLLNEGNLLSFLLRFSFFGSKSRAERFWPVHHPLLNCITPITPRPSYRVFKEVSKIVPGEFDAAGEPKRVFKRKRVSTTDNSEYAMYHFLKTGERFRMTMPPFINLPLIWKRAVERIIEKKTKKEKKAA